MATTDREKQTGGGEEGRRRYEATPEREGELFSTISGVENEPLYSPENVDLDYERDLGLPGEFPFTRGVYPSMYRGRLWTMRQFAGFGTAAETNARFRYLLDHGQTGLSTAFDMPTLMGYDSDHARSLGEVGREGVAIDSLADVETLFSGIPLAEVSTSMTINGPAAMPLMHPVSISGYHIREAGATAAQELAFTLADGFAYVDACVARGLDVDEFAPRLSFFFNAHLDLFEEVAKYRAARRIWARELRERYGAKNPRSWLMRFHTQTA